jgi:hypothetical protein
MKDARSEESTGKKDRDDDGDIVLQERRDLHFECTRIEKTIGNDSLVTSKG